MCRDEPLPIGPNISASSLTNKYRKKASLGIERNIVNKKSRHLNRTEGFIRKWVSLLNDMTTTPHVSFPGLVGGFTVDPPSKKGPFGFWRVPRY
jgi:hypothetical protein